VRKVNDHAVDFITEAPNPILPNVFVRWLMMSKKWCIDNRAERPVDKRKGVENVASFKANGTGPFRVRSRDPGNPHRAGAQRQHWDKLETNIDEVVFTPIANPSTRVAGADLGRDRHDGAGAGAGRRAHQRGARAGGDAGAGAADDLPRHGPEADELLSRASKGKNPFKDKRVRQAFYQAIDIEADQDHRDARRGHPGGADGGARRGRLPAI